MSDDRRAALAAASLVLAVVAPMTYALQRLYELARTGEVDPSLIIATTHTAYFWRCAVASWFALGCAALVYATRRGWLSLPRRAAQLAGGSVILGLLAALAAFRWP